MKAACKSPWAWIPSLYFFEGLPYFIVNTVSVIILKRLSLGNGDVAMYTGLLYLPWVIKPLWSPFVDIFKTKRWWVITMQAVIAVSLWATVGWINADVVDKGPGFYILLGLFWLSAFASATHDIAADGFYMLALDEHSAAQFVGLRNTFYRIASVFGQGCLVVLAGVLETSMNDIPAAWRITMICTSALLFLIMLWHLKAMPRVEATSGNKGVSGGQVTSGAGGVSGAEGIACRETGTTAHSTGMVLRSLGRSFSTFFRKKGILVALLFMLLYRLPESFIVKMINPFFLDPVSEGGLGFTTGQVGLVYGTFGAIALIAGGILGGLAAARWGLKKCLWPMALSLTLPCFVFVWMATFQPSNIWLVGMGVCLDQFGYGFGFTAYTLYLMYFSRGEFITSHYSLCTAFMALSMMIPGMFAGYLQEALGYKLFFWFVILCFIATFAVVSCLKVDSSYGKKVS